MRDEKERLLDILDAMVSSEKRFARS